MNGNNHHGLTALEAGWILQKTEGQVRGMLDRDELSYLPGQRKIDPESVDRHLTYDAERLALLAMAEGRIRAPKPLVRHGEPVSLYPVLLWFLPGVALMQMVY